MLRRLKVKLEELRVLREHLAQCYRRSSANGGADRAPHPTPEQRYGLTPREAEVAGLLSQGLSNSAIAAALAISTHTARHHTQHVLSKLGVSSRAPAAAILRDVPFRSRG